MSSGKDRVFQAAQQCQESGHERTDGAYVDPLPVQKVAIHEGFRQSAEDDTFDVWSVVNPKAALQENNTVAENMERVVNRWNSTVDSPEMKERVIQLQEEMQQEQGADQEQSG